MVADKIQSFYGMDREAVRAAMLKLNFSSDQFFSEIYKKLVALKNQNKLNNQ
jgi:hypothetical protein